MSDVAHLAALAESDAIGDERKRADFLQMVRRGVSYVDAAKTIGSTGYLVLCRAARDSAFARALRAAMTTGDLLV